MTKPTRAHILGDVCYHEFRREPLYEIDGKRYTKRKAEEYLQRICGPVRAWALNVTSVNDPQDVFIIQEIEYDIDDEA